MADNLDEGREGFPNRAFPPVLASFALPQNTRGDQHTKTGDLFWLGLQRLQSMTDWSSCFWARVAEHSIVGVWFGKALTSRPGHQKGRKRKEPGASTPIEVMSLMPGGPFTRPVCLPVVLSWGAML